LGSNPQKDKTKIEKKREDNILYEQMNEILKTILKYNKNGGREGRKKERDNI